MQARFGMDRSNRGAALLLMKVRMIAIDEICSDVDSVSSWGSPSCKLLSGKDSPDPVPPPSEYSSDNSSTSEGGTPSLRCRTVSFSSQEIGEVSPLSPRFSLSLVSEESEGDKDLLVTGPSTRIVNSDDTPTTECPPDKILSVTHFSQCSSKKEFVGNKIDGPVKATLRKKFSWKSYPELEGYLVQHRQKYLQYSSSLNYTAEQKRYNNTLTQGLLDLAARSGYVFEEFTFAAVRDRIRCYYKSYVQAIKKKKRKKRR